MATIFSRWTNLIEPILCRALAIIPHLREIISIAFKPFNGRDILDDHDETHLRNRIEFINHKFSYITTEKVNTTCLDNQQRSFILEWYNMKLEELEKTMYSDLIKPIIWSLLQGKPNEMILRGNLFMKFFDKEMKHSLLMSEKSLVIKPIKESVLRRLDRGLDYLLDYHPSMAGLDTFRGNFMNIIEDRSIRDSKSWRFKESNRITVSMLGTINHIWNIIGAGQDRFLTQFHRKGIPSLYYFCTPKGCELAFIFSDDVEVEFDHLILCVSFTLRLLRNTDLFNEQMMEYNYPKRPIEQEILRGKENERSWMENLEMTYNFSGLPSTSQSISFRGF